MRYTFLFTFLLFTACSGDDRRQNDCDCSDGEVCEDGVCVDGSGSGAGAGSGASVGSGATSGAGGSSSAGAGGGGTTGCHLSCACYEPPFHPSEISCSTACSTIASLCASDPGCWACTYYSSSSECNNSCDGIAATWDQPNVATYLADVVYGCAMQNSTCAGMTSCNDEIVAQQQTVCP